VLAHRTGTLHRVLTHGAGALLLHGVLAHRARALHRVLTHRTGAALLHRALAGAGAVLLHRVRAVARAVLLGAGTGGQLRHTALLGRAHLLRRHRLRSGYGGGHRTVLRLGLAHVLLVLRGGPGSGGQFGPQVLVLTEQTGQLRLHLIEEGVDLILVIALSEADGRELLVPNVLGGQRHLFTST
jgi:hypothetical protein